MKKKMENRSNRYDMDTNMDTNLVNVKSVSVWSCLYVLSNTWGTFEAEFMKKLTHFMPLISFDTPWKQKTRGFLMFSGGIKRDQLH